MSRQRNNRRWLRAGLLLTVLAVGRGWLVDHQGTRGGRAAFSVGVRSRAEFDVLAVTYDADTPYALPHALFVIDRQSKNRIYYVNTKLYKFHKDFVNGTYLSLERGQEFFENNYLKPNRRFILGTIAYQTPVQKWTFEFWEGDLIPPDQIKLASEVINQTFLYARRFQAELNATGRGDG